GTEPISLPRFLLSSFPSLSLYSTQAGRRAFRFPQAISRAAEPLLPPPWANGPNVVVATTRVRNRAPEPGSPPGRERETGVHDSRVAIFSLRDDRPLSHTLCPNRELATGPSATLSLFH
ncbi:hypothetical protein LY78DRAFT_490175, partial [Colletotrichum sublineola]